METANKRSKQIDAARALAILCVLYIHVTSDFAYADGESLTYALFNHINKLFYIAVPTFVAITVYLGLKSGKRRGAGYVLKHTAHILWLYLLWSAIYVAFNCLNGAPLPDKETIIYKYLLQGGACYHLYYVVMLVQLYGVIALLSFLPIKKLKPRLWQLAAAVGVQELVLCAFIRFIVMRFWFYNTAIFAAFYLVPIMYGVIAAADTEAVKALFYRFKWLFGLIYVLSVPALAYFYAHGANIFGENYIAHSLTETLFRMLNFSGIPLIIMLAQRLKEVSPLSVLGRHSLGVYFAHPLILSLMGLCYDFSSGSTLKLVLGMGIKAAVLTAFAFGFAYASEKFKRLLKA